MEENRFSFVDPQPFSPADQTDVDLSMYPDSDVEGVEPSLAGVSLDTVISDDAIEAYCGSAGLKKEDFFVDVYSYVIARFSGKDVEKIGGDDVEQVSLMPDEGAPISMQTAVADGNVRFEFKYRSDIFSKEFMMIFAGCVEKAAQEYLAQTAPGDISLMTPQVRALIDGFNETAHPDPVSDIVTMFRETVEKYADKPAVFFKDRFFTYREVDETSERIASYLRSKGVGRGSVVSILIPRCEYIVIAALGALKSGAGYQPLDPSYPVERLNFMVKDAACKVLIADEALLEKVSEYDGPVLLTKDIPSLPECEKIKDHPEPEDLFVLLYTSGTTGVPKGVRLVHYNLCNYCWFGHEDFGYDENTRSAGYASFGFDVIMMDTYPTLTCGGCVYIVEEELRLDLVAMEKWFNRHEITHSIMTTQVARQFYTAARVPTLKHLTGAGEKMTPVQPVEGETDFYNGYGPSECTILCSIFKIDRFYRRIPIGKAMRNVKLYVVDKNLHLLPPLVPGELLIAGRGVGCGYLNRPEQTEKVFINNPFSDDPEYATAYRTGDVVRYLPDGNIDFIGRNDSQVKVRGFRIELTEIESIIREFSGIKDATVQAFEDETTGEKFITAYVVSDSEVDVDAMNDYILSKKPPYMVPAVTMQIDAIPLNQNQKVNKRALPKPEKKTKKAESDAPAAPLNVLEEDIRSIAAEIIKFGDFGITERFGDLGLTSISGIQLSMQIYKKYDVQLNPRELVAEGCIQSVENAILAKLLNGDAKTTEKTDESPADKGDKKTSCHLSFTQQGVYADCQANPESVRYNLPMLMKFPDGITQEQLKNAVTTVTDAHPYIFCRFVPDENNEIIQEPIPDHKLELPVLEMSAEEFKNHRSSFVRPFDLKNGPVVRFEIIQADSLYLLFDMHHLVSDGASVDIFFEQICQALDGVEIEKEKYDYYDFVADEKIAPEAEDFFAGRMAEMEDATSLIADVYEEGIPHTEKEVSIATDLTKVKEFAKQQGVTPAAVYLAASYITYARYVCEDTVAIATISNGRSNLKLGNTLGMFVNTLPLVISLDNDEKVSDFLSRVASGFSDTIDHENYPFARIASKYDFHPAASYTYQIGVINDYSTKAGSVEVQSLESDIAKLPVGIYIIGDENDASIQAVYDSAMYSDSMMQGLVQSVENVVQGLMSSETVSQISLTGEEQWKELDSYNKPWDLDYDKADTAVSVFRKNAKAQPDKVAAVCRDKAYTYRELDELSDRLAAKIYKKACEITGKTNLAEEVAAILLNRNENVFILPLAALKAGLAYEPLDPSYPKERLNFMVKDANCSLLIAEDEIKDLVDEYEGTVLTVNELYSMEDASKLPEGPKPEDMFVMLYTSGSTGVPKGCQLEHRNLVSYAHGVRNDFYTKNDVIAAYASFGFDVNMSDIFCTLLNGGTVHLIPEETRMNLSALKDYFDDAGITAALLTTQVGVQFLQNYPTLKSFRMLVMGGEKLPAVDPSKLSYTIVNGYGPTENCCGVSLFPIKAWEKNVPIGKPMSSIHAYVLDKTGHRLPAGAAGEYCLSGPQVSRGYLNRPDKTAEAYEDCPFNEFRMYHTGDIVRYRKNGDVEFVGRKDGQVKIRGFRIETKEVESVIRGYDGIDDVTVQVYDYEGGGKYLTAFVVGAETLDVEKLTDYIKSQKPAYMVPAVIMQIDEIPLTVNQKVDKKALPEPKLQKAAYVAPEGKTETDFCEIFGSVLGLEKVSAEDDFFDIGGSSILAMKVVVAAEKAGYSIVYNDVFSHTTPRDIAEFIDGDKKESSVSQQTTASETPSEIPTVGTDGYDYTKINDLLSQNTIEAFLNGQSQPLNDVLLFGGTGYLGSHVLHELITEHDNKVFCFVRPGKDESGKNRLKSILKYYFEDDYEALFDSRITVIEGDATNADSLMSFEAPTEKMTVINCAASVKHFARGNEIERTNVDSVKNITKWCLKNDARLVHISTGSVAGARKNGMPPESFVFDEHGFYYGQTVDNNQYVHSKFMAERHVYEEIIEHNLSAKVLRVGNLAPRLRDGGFQINYSTNNYMNTFKAYQTLGIIPYGALNEIVEFSPIDCLAKAVVAIATTPKECVCFIPLNPHRPLMGDVVTAFKEEGFDIKGVEPAEFESAFTDALADEKTREAVGSLAAYNSNDNTSEIGLESCDNSLTTQILERLGFSWPETGVSYIVRFLKYLEQKGFFGGNDK